MRACWLATQSGNGMWRGAIALSLWFGCGGEPASELTAPEHAPASAQVGPSDLVAAPQIVMGESRVLPWADANSGDALFAQDTWLGQEATLTSLHFHVEASAGLLRLGLYDATGSGGTPGDKIAETAEFIPTNGWNDVPVLTPITLSPGTYWLAFLPSAMELTFNRDAEHRFRSFWSPYPYGELPATFPSTSRSWPFHWSYYAALQP